MKWSFSRQDICVYCVCSRRSLTSPFFSSPFTPDTKPSRLATTNYFLFTDDEILMRFATPSYHRPPHDAQQLLPSSTQLWKETFDRTSRDSIWMTSLMRSVRHQKAQVPGTSGNQTYNHHPVQKVLKNFLQMFPVMLECTKLFL